MDAIRFLIVLAIVLASGAAAASEPAHVVSKIAVLRKSEVRITNGHAAFSGQFPYQAELLIRMGFLHYSWCSGSIISSKWLLTAAQCTSDAQRVFVNIGDIAHKYIFGSFTFDCGTDDIWVHPNHDSSTRLNDISLVRAPESYVITFSASVQPISLPKIAFNYSDYVAERADVSGWGKFSDSDISSPDEPSPSLLYAKMNVTSGAECAFIFPMFDEGNICVSTRNSQSACLGDAGAPLVLSSTRIPVQIGLASYCIRPCESGKPTVFTRITHHLRWIRHVTKIWY